MVWSDQNLTLFLDGAEKGRWEDDLLKFMFLKYCEEDNLEGVTDCLARGVDVNTLDRQIQWTGLMFACEAGNSAIVSRLVQVPGLDINYQDEGGITAALQASKKGRTECVRILAETKRVDWSKGKEGGRTPLYKALLWGYSDIVDIIKEQPNIDFIETQERARKALSNEIIKRIETTLGIDSRDLKWLAEDDPRKFRR